MNNVQISHIELTLLQKLFACDYGTGIPLDELDSYHTEIYNLSSLDAVKIDVVPKMPANIFGSPLVAKDNLQITTEGCRILAEEYDRRWEEHYTQWLINR